MRIPKFWDKNPPKILKGLSILYQAAQCLYEWKRTPSVPFRMKFPVISVGGLTLGGAGKTSCSLALAQWLTSLGYKCIMLTRGYKGQSPGPMWVSEKDTPHSVGEEAWMMAQHFPVFIAKNILQGAQYLHHTLISNENTLIIWDDGHQYPKVHKDLAFIVTNTQQYFGNTWVFPAGPLRESLSGGIKRAHGIICLSPQVPVELPETLSFWTSSCFPVECRASCSLPKNTPVVGFCGLGNPERFWNTLHYCGLTLKAQVTFPDHYFYTSKDEVYLQQVAQNHQAVLITSRKDYVKLSSCMQTLTHQVLQSIVLSLELQKIISEMLKQYNT
ncbi:tetraacyldisaccharide 4'-kinase [Holospora curviuscula]|uniref:Tetraacyldisaccharide 4'-kinase n=1 Tax=Holospora curviuscula TaxID=1082868 RepID=A0A2S5RA83_9PROT|nr:tetraacyldisaccharide 4'-kinase [Holospora curviuscula]PPE04244.1 Tetraacyldisaccharide 4'-kinase [Holospora curviuscula]